MRDDNKLLKQILNKLGVTVSHEYDSLLLPLLGNSQTLTFWATLPHSVYHPAIECRISLDDFDREPLNSVRIALFKSTLTNNYGRITDVAQVMVDSTLDDKGMPLPPKERKQAFREYKDLIRDMRRASAAKIV